MCVYVCVCLSVCTWVYICVCMCVYVCEYVCLCVFVYVVCGCVFSATDLPAEAQVEQRPD